MPNLASARAQRFHAYVERLTTGLGHRDRHGPLRDYVTGLCLPGERKSVEPMAARVDPRHVRARHQSMHHFIANAAWDDRAVLRVARETVLAALARHGPVAAWVVDDTGMPKKGRHSVGVARQYCGVLGKEENCQVAVSVSVAHERASVPGAYRLYLPKVWAQDRRRRPPEMADRARADYAAHERGHSDRARGRRCRLWRCDRVPRRADGSGHSVHRGNQQRDDGLGARARAVGRAEVSRLRSAADVGAPDAAPSPTQRVRLGPATAGVRVAHGDVAPGHARRDALALRGGSGPARASRRLAIDATARRMAAHRMATDRSGADQVLALDVAADRDAHGTRPVRHAALADRTRLSRTERRARARSLRGPRLARLPSSRVALHRRVRVLGRGAAGAFPP